MRSYGRRLLQRTRRARATAPAFLPSELVMISGLSDSIMRSVVRLIADGSAAVAEAGSERGNRGSPPGAAGPESSSRGREIDRTGRIGSSHSEGTVDDIVHLARVAQLVVPPRVLT